MPINAAVQAIEEERISGALAENNSISAVHPAEEFYKEVLEVYCNRWSKGTYELSLTDSSVLSGIAFLSAAEGGDAVYLARMLLDTLIHDPEPPARFGNEELQEESPAYSVKVYPNPALNSITIQITGEIAYPVELRIMDLSGRIIERKIQFSPEQPHILENIAAGVYLYEIQGMGKLLQRGKLVLINR